MEVATLLAQREKSKIYGIIGNINITTNNSNYSIVSLIKFKGSVKEYLNSSKSTKALKIVMLDESYLEKEVNALSDSEIKIISLAKALIDNKDYIVLDYFEKGLNYKEKENYKRLLKKLCEEYNKTLLLHTNDVTFLWDITDELFIVDKNNIINNYTKKEYLKLSSIDKPEIIKFIDLMSEAGIKIEKYKNPMDLLKAIYRIKGE